MQPVTRQRFQLLLWLVLLFLSGCGRGTLNPAESFDASVRRAVEAYQQGNPSKARRALKEAVEVAGGESEAYVSIGKQLIAVGRPNEAATFLLEALKKPAVDWDPLLWATLADAWGNAGNAAAAADAHKEAGRRADAIVTFRGRPSGQESSPADRAVQRLLQASFYYLRDDIDNVPAAIAALRAAHALAPDDPTVLNALGYTLADKGTSRRQFTEALTLIEKALQLTPDAHPMTPMILDSLGWARFKTGDLNGARRALREATDRAPTEPELRYHLGVVYAQLGLIREAEGELTRALLLKKGDYPEAKRAKELLRRPPGEGVVEGA